ncbi:hypothetical protein MOE21_18015 [Bacillus atrophaeus]|uniref:hypothetical protein n=1 Tax=Bacillus atrophaeus TaxID=1452 RepID=UPI002282446A|nr:hypothetical protein [Bacillus atrophaeus]MCY8934477.1 hypothetical protein [Bacillus atrophaeus]
MKNVKTIGLHIEGALFNEDGTEFTYNNFIKLIESNGIEFGGQTCVITDEGKFLDGTGIMFTKDKPIKFNQKEEFREVTNYEPVELSREGYFNEDD